MNAISRLRGTRADAAVPVIGAGLEEYYAQVRSYQAARARSVRRVGLAAWCAFAVVLVANLMLAGGLLTVLPAVRLVPVFIYPHPDGTVDSAVSLSQLPASAQDAVVQSELWQYVMLREGYAHDTAAYAYAVVSAMSAPVVRQQYQQWFNYPNATSPQVVWGKQGFATLERISGSYLAPDVYRLEFYRTVVAQDGAKPVRTRWIATLHFTRVETIPTAQRVQFNPAGVIITSYPGAEEVGAP